MFCQKHNMQTLQELKQQQLRLSLRVWTQRETTDRENHNLKCLTTEFDNLTKLVNALEKAEKLDKVQ